MALSVICGVVPESVFLCTQTSTSAPLTAPATISASTLQEASSASVTKATSSTASHTAEVSAGGGHRLLPAMLECISMNYGCVYFGLNALGFVCVGFVKYQTRDVSIFPIEIIKLSFYAARTYIWYKKKTKVPECTCTLRVNE